MATRAAAARAPEAGPRRATTPGAGATAPVAPLTLACVAFALAAACSTTTDSLGYDQPGGRGLRPLTGPSSYPNAFRDVLGKSDAEINAKIAAAFAQLFHGDPSSAAIYFPVGDDQAYVKDVLHGDERTEGISYAMLIAVELDKRDEFDRLWRWTQRSLQYTRGPNSGYLVSACQQADQTAIACVDPFGMQQITMALLLANDRWGGGATAGGAGGGAAAAVIDVIDYAAGARGLLDVMLHKQEQNGGVVDDVTDLFDRTWQLPVDVPTAAGQGVSRPSIVMPAYYDLWAQATTDPFWPAAAAAGRAYWQRAMNRPNGLSPVRATFPGAPVTGWDAFRPEVYRAHFHIVLDQIWSGGGPASGGAGGAPGSNSDGGAAGAGGSAGGASGAGASWDVTESDRLLAFFAAQGIDTYGTSYALDGTVLDAARDLALVVTNGASALVSTRSDRASFVGAVWNLPVPVGAGRYYTGVLQLMALLALGGQLRVY